MADVGSLLGGLGVGGNIGKAIVQLELETTKYKAEMQAAHAQTTTATRGLGNSFSQFGGLAQAALLGVGVAAVAGLGAAVNAAIEAERAQARLQNTLDNAPQLAGASADAFLNLAEEIRSVTGADDEAIISGEALLGQMGLQQDAILELTPLVVDLSTKYGIDLNTAFKAVGKAAQGNTGSLARYVGTIEAGATPAETLTNVLDKLGASAGFAAEQAENEPWVLLKSDLEELAEDLGTALLPAIRGISDALQGAIPIIEKVAEAFKFLPLAQVSADLEEIRQRTDEGGAGWKDYADLVLDTIPILGHYIDISGGASEATEDQVNVITHLSNVIRGRYAAAISVAGQKTSGFARMTKQELREWTDTVEESFDTFVFKLEESAEATRITRQEFMDATRVMQREARQLADAMKELSKEKWVNDDYIAFLSEQGPEWLIGFADLTERQQRRAQDAWEESNRKTTNAKQNFENIIDTLGRLDRGSSHHKVTIEYDYVGFDPSKPGMKQQAGP